MTARTRYFVITSLLVLAVGVGTGLVAYYVGLPAGAFSSQGGPEELQFVPHDAALVAFANVQDVMQSEVRQKLRSVLPMPGQGQDEFERETGINIDTDIDRVVACLSPVPANGGTSAGPDGLVIARGRFDAVRIESLMREHGGQVETYKDVRLIVAAVGASDQPPGHNVSVAFLEPGLAAIGSTRLVRQAIDLKAGGSNITANDEVMALIRTVDEGNAWAVGRFDALSGRLPSPVTDQLPAITWFSASGNINGGISGVVRVETRDEESANNLREVMRGIVALAKMQLGSRPDFEVLTRSLELGGTGKTVALSFEVPAELIDMLAGLHGGPGGQEPRSLPQ